MAASVPKNQSTTTESDDENPPVYGPRKQTKREMQQERKKKEKKKEQMKKKRAELDENQKSFAHDLSKVHDLNKMKFCLPDHKDVIVEIAHAIMMHDVKKLHAESLNTIKQLDEMVGDFHMSILSEEAKKFLATFNTYFCLVKLYQQTKVPSLTLSQILKMKAADGHPVMQDYELSAKDNINKFINDAKRVLNTKQGLAKAVLDSNHFHEGKCVTKTF